MVDTTDIKINELFVALKKFGCSIEEDGISDDIINTYLLKDMFVESKFIKFLNIVENFDMGTNNKFKRSGVAMPIGIKYVSTFKGKFEKALALLVKYDNPIEFSTLTECWHIRFGSDIYKDLMKKYKNEIFIGE